MTSKEAKVYIIDALSGDMNKDYFISDILPKILQDLEALNILKSKDSVSFWDLEYIDDVEEYNKLYLSNSQITEEEFNKLKEWLENE